MMNVSCSPLSECFVVLVYLGRKLKTMYQGRYIIVRCHGGAVPKNEETLSVLNSERRTFEVDCGEMGKFYYVRHKKKLTFVRWISPNNS